MGFFRAKGAFDALSFSVIFDLTSGRHPRPTSPSVLLSFVAKPVVTLSIGLSAGILLSALCNRWEILEVDLWNGRLSGWAQASPEPGPPQTAPDLANTIGIADILGEEITAFRNYFGLTPTELIAQAELVRVEGVSFQLELSPSTLGDQRPDSAQIILARQP